MNSYTIHQCADGSNTISVGNDGDTFHSIHGALSESKHVFIQNGLQELVKTNPDFFKVLEVGFGTGLNFLLTALEAQNYKINFSYHAIEPFPIDADTFRKLNYFEILPDLLRFKGIVEKTIDTAIESDFLEVSNPPLFLFKQKWANFNMSPGFDLIYYDAFAPQSAPELWTFEALHKTFKLLKPGGIWVSYCAKGEVRRTLQATGFKVERLSGPPGKREMLRAIKP